MRKEGIRKEWMRKEGMRQEGMMLEGMRKEGGSVSDLCRSLSSVVSGELSSVGVMDRDCRKRPALPLPLL
ncbi:hypothetical protein EYF80_003187 [Liparis tanakae]|uniref:Uncharacterized protein n=1 Tax=Liparis tanakae TaxID=230148 RepID=A0A4Z2J8S2_9TELE|nr:hypothetical protein EYF80_003187 [Liparis tanakae]